MNNALAENQKTFNSLVDLFRLLNEAGCIIGRDDQRIVIDERLMPKLLRDEGRSQFMGYRLTGGGFMNVFTSCSSNGDHLFLKIDGVLDCGQDDEKCFPLIGEIRRLIASVRPINCDESQVFSVEAENIQHAISDAWGGRKTTC